MTTHIYLIRHGEVFNPKKILYGRLPGFGLSENGKREIEQTAHFLKSKHIDLIYSSPLLRAKQTARIIQKKINLSQNNTSKKVLEVRTSFQGRLFADLAPDQSDVYFSPDRAKTDETFVQIASRMQNFIDELAKKHPGKHIAVISHGDPIMLLAAAIKKLPLVFESIREGEKFSYIKHGEVYEITISNEGGKTIKSIFQPVV
jgi:broad specificity phosphatase PhoE